MQILSIGFGTNGGRGRCWPFFQEFAKCYVQADDAKEVLPDSLAYFTQTIHAVCAAIRGLPGVSVSYQGAAAVKTGGESPTGSCP